MKRIKRTISVLLSIVMLFTLLPTTALAVTQSVSFQISHSNGASGTVSYRFGSEENFTDVVLNDGGAASVNVPNEATTITVKAVPAEGYAINQSHSGVYTSGSCTTRFDFDALAGENGFAYTLTDDSPQFQIEFDNNDGTGGDGGDGEGGESGDSLTIELSGSTSVSGGTFSYTNGTARVMFVRGEDGGGAYDSSERQITLDNDVTAVKIILSADEGYTGVLRTGGNNPPVPDPTVNDGESTYIFERSALEAAGSLVAFNIEFTGGSGGDYPGPDPEPDWYTVSWDGGNVTVENGTVLAERVRVAAHDDQPETIYTAIASEYNASADDHVFSLMDTIGKEKENENDPDALQLYGLGFSPSDLFIAKDLSGVSIDFKFVPDYGYQLSDILTNETDSLLSGFTASASEISSFNFAVRPGSNVHFNVVFSKAEDTIQNNSSTVTSATIANGQNAATSGNLKMTIADLDEEAVSDDLKAKAGESALYLDMNLYQVVSKGGENGNWENQLEDLSNTITVTLSVPAPAEGSSYYIIREHGDGENKTYSRIAVAYDPATGTITFETDKFSNYALAQAADNVTTDTDVQNADKVTAAGISTNYAWADTLPESAESATAVKLTVANNSNVAADVQASLKNAAGVTVDETKSFYLDITMTATVSGSDTSITNLRQPVTVALTVPAILASEKYTVVRAHTDGSNTTYEKLSSSYDRTSSALTFQTDRFSIYAIYVSPAYTIITVAAKNQSIYVNGTVPDLTSPVKDTHYTVTGLAAGDTLGGTLTMKYQKDGVDATPDATKTGTYDIVISGATAPAGGNYNDVVFTAGTLTISNRPSSGGGSSSGSSSSTTTVPVSNSKNEVKVTASVSGSTATVQKMDLSKINQAQGVTIDFTGLGKTIESAKLPTSAIKEIGATEGGTLTVKLTAGNVTFDTAALKAVADQAGSQITLALTPAKTSALNASQKEAVGDAPVFDLRLLGGSKAITDFKGGNVTVTLPHTLSEGQNPAGVVVYYLSNDGNPEACNTTYDAKNKLVTFTTTHFSLYFVGYKQPAAEWENPFTDVAEGAWYYDSIKYVYSNGMMVDTGDTKFSPNATTTRGMIVTILYRLEGEPAVSGTSSFNDVAEGKYYANAVKWAAENEIVGGYGNGQFGPEDPITREQMAAILYRYATFKGFDMTKTADLSKFTDSGKISDWSKAALSWANAEGLVNGKGGGILDPLGNATRAEVSAILHRFCENVVK